MRLYQPNVDAEYYRRSTDLLHTGIDLTATRDYPLDADVIVNLAGENRPDVVEKDPAQYREINVNVPERIAAWCDQYGKHYVHISTQGIFSGDNPPYGPDSRVEPINEYGKQKAEAEVRIRGFRNWTILRPTFVLGIRPLPHIGRQNPLEQMLENPTGKQVNDRWFSPLFAREAALAIWQAVMSPAPRQIIHLGTPVPVSRYDVAVAAGGQPEAVSHEYFVGFAPRPRDTHYSLDTVASLSLGSGIAQCKADKSAELLIRAREIALFFGMSENAVLQKLLRGFVRLHQEVTADFNQVNPDTDIELLEWYRWTDSYIWELTAYHLDEGFNYSGMCQGIVDRLRTDQAKRVLCLGDGIGTLTLALRQAGINAVYHDLKNSQTAAFAQFRFWMHTGEVGESILTDGWRPRFNCEKFETIICFDFLEHMTDVPTWMRTIKDLLCPGGVALFQNAFGIGSEGSIPMHLKRNDRYEKEWTPLMSMLGFQQEGTSNWWRAA
jgi:dTDP-4-dehydrorhamnose reductase